MPVDVHVHVGGRYDEMVARNLDGGLVDAAIVSCVHSSLGDANYQPTPEDVRWCNDYTLSWMERYPQRVHGLAYVNPRHGEVGLTEMRRCLDRGMVGAKLLLCVFADDPRVDPFVRLAIERDVPVLAHAWVKTTGNLPYESRPQNVMRLAQRFPMAKLILAHWGGEWETGAKVLGECPNLYVDVSGTPAETDSLEGLVQAAGEDRVMFGTDNTNCHYCLGKVAGARLSDEQRRKVLTTNATRLFRL
jgi:uncharacterized protein